MDRFARPVNDALGESIADVAAAAAALQIVYQTEQTIPVTCI